MLEFDFMKRALLGGLMLAIIVPLIGVVMVNRKTAMVGDALSHTSLVGVALGLIISFDPVLGAIMAAVVSAIAIEKIRKTYSHMGDMATAVVMALGLGLAAVLSSFAPGGSSFESYLFGSITSITRSDLILMASVFILVLVFFIKYYTPLMDLSIDSNLARLTGVPVEAINIIFTILSAVTIALASKMIGALLVSSIMILPVATSLMVSRSYKESVIISVVLGMAYMIGGISLSYYFDIKPGGSITLIAIGGILVFYLGSKLRGREVNITKV